MSNSYPFANGAIKSLENKLIDRNKLYRLQNLSEKELIKQLYDAGFGTNVSSIDDLILSEEEKIKDIINLHTPDKELTDLFFISQDAKNIKLLYKSKMFNIDVKMDDSGTLSGLEFKESIIDGKVKSVALGKILNEVDQKVNQNTKARLVSIIIDQCMFKYALKVAKKSTPLYHYFVNRIDYINLLTLIRVVRLGWKKEELEVMLIKGGKIKHQDLLKVFEVGLDKMKSILVTIDNPLLGKIVEYYLTTNDVVKFEHYLDQQLINDMEQYKSDAFSLGPIIYYSLAFNAEIKNIRLISSNNEVELDDLFSY